MGAARPGKLAAGESGWQAGRVRGQGVAPAGPYCRALLATRSAPALLLHSGGGPPARFGMLGCRAHSLVLRIHRHVELGDVIVGAGGGHLAHRARLGAVGAVVGHGGGGVQGCCLQEGRRGGGGGGGQGEASSVGGQPRAEASVGGGRQLRRHAACTRGYAGLEQGPAGCRLPWATTRLAAEFGAPAPSSRRREEGVQGCRRAACGPSCWCKLPRTC